MDYKKITLIIVAIIEFIIILFVYGVYDKSFKEQRKLTYIFAEVSPNKAYKIKFYEIGVTYPHGSTNVDIAVSYKGETRRYITIEVHNEGGVTKDNFNIQWTEEGAIINVTQCDAPNITYRIYWEDVFGERTKNN